MMCRCQDIEKCERDIALLNGEINRKLNCARDNQDITMAKHFALSQALSGAVFIRNQEKVSQRLSMIRKRQGEQIENMRTKRSSELSRLRNRLENYQNEDRNYHEKTAQRVGR